MLDIGKLHLLAFNVLQRGEGVGVEGEFGLVAAEVGDRDGDGGEGEVVLRLAGRRGFDVVEGDGAVGGGDVKV